MSNHYHHAILAAALIASITSFVKHAPGQSPGDVSAEAPPVAAAGLPSSATTDDSRPCVLLHNDNVLFGRATQQGEFVVIRRGPHSEIRLSRKEVACWAPSVRDLYQFRLDHREKGDLSAHIKDAAWCIRYDLFDQAAEEIRAIRLLDSENKSAERLERQLNSALADSATSDPSQSSVVVQPVGFQDPQVDVASIGLVALRDFAMSVQPMLLNRCGKCHSHTSDRHWKLNTPHGGARASSRMTHENLASSLAYIDRGQPTRSELFIKAMTAHGGAPAALNSRHGKAIAAFEQWLRSLRPTAMDEPVNRRAPNVGRFAGHEIGASDPPRNDAPTQSLQSWMNQPADASDAPARLPQVANPFDPELFNRRHHPD